MIAPQESPLLRSRHLTVAIDRNGIEIIYEPPTALTLGSALRRRDICNRVKTKLKQARPTMRSSDGERISACFGFEALHKLTAIIPEIDLMLDGFSKERLTPRMVQETLGIGSVERRRWTKDGRLPKSGMVSFRRGQQSFYLYLHSPDKIARLAANPAIIPQWRDEDAARSPAPVFGRVRAPAARSAVHKRMICPNRMPRPGRGTE
jgi:hypothetical protein